MRMRRFDDLTLYVSDLEDARRFYHEVFDMPVLDEQSTTNSVTVRCGHQLIRLQKADDAHQTFVGRGEFSVVARDSMHDIKHHFISYEVEVIAPVHDALGAEGPMQEMTIADPDRNIIHVVVYQNK